MVVFDASFSEASILFTVIMVVTLPTIYDVKLLFCQIKLKKQLKIKEIN